MNKFMAHIPNYVETDERLEFEFDTLDSLVDILKINKGDLRYNAPHLLLLTSDDGTKWEVLGKIKYPIREVKEWEGAVFIITEIEEIRGYGLDNFEPKFIGEEFKVYSNEMKMTSSFKGRIIGELKNGKYFIGVRCAGN